MTQTTDNQKRTKLHYGWIVFVGACLLMIPEALIMNTAPIFYTPVSTDLGVSLSTYAVSMSIMPLCVALSMVITSKLFEKLNIRVFMSAVIVVEACCFIAYSLAQSIIVMYVASAFIGVCFGVLVNLTVPLLVNNWFSKNVATLIGIGTAMQGVAGAVFSFLGGILITNYGWRICYVVWAVVTLAVGLPITLFVLRKTPAEKGLLPYGYDAAAASASEKVVLTGLTRGQAMKTPVFWLLIIAQALFSIAILFNAYLNTYTQSLGFDAAVAATISAIVMVGMIVGKIVVGAVADRSVNAGYAIGCLCAVAALPTIVFVAGSSIPLIAVCSCLFGVAYSSTTLLGAATSRWLFGPAHYADVWAVFSSVGALFGALGSTFWGLFVETIGYTSTFVVVAVFFALTLVFATLAIQLGKRVRRQFAQTGAEGEAELNGKREMEVMAAEGELSPVGA